MSASTVIEMIGYLGSALVLVSMLMTSVVKLRLINLTGSIIFAGYALMIRSYPTALMNIALAGINIFYLVRMFREQKIYDAIPADRNDGYFSYLLDRYHDDILRCFPDTALDAAADVTYLVCCDSDPACLFLGKETAPGKLEVVLDYATPVYRDASAGKFLYRRLAEDGYETLAFRQNAEAHVAFLKKTGYENRGEEGYVLDLKKHLC
ncbi:MAG: YgjV family protein [Lachnospiraceae bacterium]|nr:YgjV family protein [Lachnospiraceae bacterium]